MAFKFSLGIYVIDKITKFKGCIISRNDSITGCNLYDVQPEVNEKGEYVAGMWIDEHCLEVDTERQQLKLHREAGQPPG